jgi:hypothetical protein
MREGLPKEFWRDPQILNAIHNPLAEIWWDRLRLLGFWTGTRIAKPEKRNEDRVRLP